MAENKPDTKALFDCKDCEDTGKVRLSLSGANGDLVREVPCPSCKRGMTLDAGIPDAEVLRGEFTDKLRALAFLVGLALALGAMALLVRSKSPDGFSQVLKDTEVVQ